MAWRDCLDWLLKLLYFLIIHVGLALIGYEIYLFFVYISSTQDLTAMFPIGDDATLIQLGRPMRMAVSLSSTVLDDIAAVWFLCAFIGVGVLLFIISCCGCIGASARSGCCLTCVSRRMFNLKTSPTSCQNFPGSQCQNTKLVFAFLLILIELGCSAFIYFDSSCEDVVPTDDTGYFAVIYAFLKEHWSIVKWVALGIVILEALVFLLACILRAANRPADYDSDEEFTNPRQPLIRPAPPVAGVPAAGALDQRPSRSDAWSARMREKYGLDTSTFTYNPSDPNRFQPTPVQPVEERGRCTIL